MAIPFAVCAVFGGLFGVGAGTRDASAAPDPSAAARDDTAALQAQLDAGGTLFLKKLKGSTCYQTRGLWVSRDGTTIDSNGACINYLGPGEVRLYSGDGDPIPAEAIFFVNRSSSTAGPPQHIKISNLRLVVPAGTDGYGVVVSGIDVTVKNIRIEGAPKDGVTINGRANGGVGYAGPASITHSRIVGAKRNGISVTGGVGITIDSNVIQGTGNPSFVSGGTVAPGGPWAGIDVEPDQTDNSIKNVTISNNSISDSGGPGLLLALQTNFGLPDVATRIAVSGNSISRNSTNGDASFKGGICLQGGEADGKGRLSIIGNAIVNNTGYGLCAGSTVFSMIITLSQNTISGNSAGATQPPWPSS